MSNSFFKENMSWVITILVILVSLVGEAWLLKTRMDWLISKQEGLIRFQQQTQDKLNFLDKYCCGEVNK